jgi:hypothetical protein
MMGGSEGKSLNQLTLSASNFFLPNFHLEWSQAWGVWLGFADDDQGLEQAVVYISEQTD